MEERIQVAYNPAWAGAFGVIQRVAERLWNTAKAETAAYVAASMPSAKTVREWHEDGKYCRRVRNPHRKGQTITYDYRTKAITLNGMEVRV